MERRLIRVQLPPDHAGVTEALRRAFGVLPAVHNDRAFDDLLKQLA